MKGIIVYGSQYGTTKQYAKELSKQTGLPIENPTEVSNLICDVIAK